MTRSLDGPTCKHGHNAFMPEPCPKCWAKERPNKSVSLHGLGFIQVELAGPYRLHVWHPELPRRSCFEHSSVHDHRFGFESTVLCGQQINHVYAVPPYPWSYSAPAYWGYKHEGARLPSGNRPWIRQPNAVCLVEVYEEVVNAGETYLMLPYIQHRTEPGGDGVVVTLMRKTREGDAGATSWCRVGVEPDTDFDRFQWEDDDLWEIVTEALRHT